MTPAARVQAAIEILDAVIEAARAGGAPADRLIADWFKTRRFAGSKDRRAVRELVYRAIRSCGEVPVYGRAAMLRVAQGDPAIAALFDGSPYGPAERIDGEPVAGLGAMPGWLVTRLAASGVDAAGQAALLERARLDIRANRLKTDREQLIARLPVAAEPTAAPDGLRLLDGARAEDWPEWRGGLFEVQDTGSQLACTAFAAQPGETIVDLCAGAGGKTLSLAAAMGNRGRLIACDVDKRRLGNLPPRAARAGATNIDLRLLDGGREAEQLADLAGTVDGVLVDAPCSGSGTWRRNPEARWRLTPDRLARLEQAQRHVLSLAAPLPRAGGRLTFITCSLLDSEGCDQARWFLDHHPGWQAEQPLLPLGEARGTGWRLAPFRDGCDGFFIATFRRL